MSSVQQKHWESANAQVRSFLESLFNDLCRILLNKNATGGDARKALATAGFLNDEQANFLFSFMKLAHTNGAHPGISNEIESQSRWYACLSIALIGVYLLPHVVRVSDVLKRAGIVVPNVSEITDGILSSECPTCEEEQFLTSCTIHEKNGETHYMCKNGCQDIVVVGKPLNERVEGKGYRLKDYVMRNAHDILIHAPNGSVVKLPKSPNSLKKL
ncbi:MAG: hypothetical protein ACYCYO_00325 [Bacilli bacterium]